ncbi:MAG: ABC transporter permease [Hydrogenophaga sp.]|nr:ABC transporter permease [Hydrogenophaga sp.]
MRRLLATFSSQELRHHPWRSAVAVLAVALGVALAFAVQLINTSALAEFGQAVAAVNGQPDAELRARQGTLDDAWVARVAAHPEVAVASPVLEVVAEARTPQGERLPLRLLGVDALLVGRVAPALQPVVDNTRTGTDRLDLFAPDTLFLNPAARDALGPAAALPLRLGTAAASLRVAGGVNTPGAPLAVMDVAALQALAGRPGALSRIDLRLAPGAALDAVVADLALPAQVLVQRPAQAGERVSNLSRAYRVNLTVLALVALFTGAFLVYSVLALSVTRRLPQFALLGVLGLAARERLRLVLAESAFIGVLGSGLGLLLGTALAALALQRLGGDLGGGYFTGVSPPLRWSTPAALLYGALGVAAALVGGWWPARAAAGLAPAQALKGLGAAAPTARRHGLALALVALAGLAALAPPVAGVPLGAYASVGLLLVGGIAALPLAVGALLDRLAPAVAGHVLPLLAVERARRLRETAAVATSGVVASLALSVALTVMVASFRDSVTHWLDAVLPAPLYLRSAGAGPDGAHLPEAFVAGVRALPGVARVDTLRALPLQFDPARPAVTLLVRPLNTEPLPLPLVGNAAAAPPGSVPVYVSEAMVDLYGARVGAALPALAQALAGPEARSTRFVVAGVWRDYARQHGSIAIDTDTFARLTRDTRVSDLALHLGDGVDPAGVHAALRTLAAQHGLADAIELAGVEQIRATSLRIFDRSFAVTVWLQAVAIGIGLFGVAASFSAQVLVRRKEFGLLAHLGFTRAQVLGVVALEGLAWTVLGALAGLGLGLLVSLVLVHVVNPQSFHWTMDLVLPWPRLLALCAAVVAAGTLTAWLSGRAAASADAVQAVKQDW